MSAPYMLPPKPVHFVGRAEVLDAASEALGKSGTRDRAIAFVGPGGIGKTTVALQLAHGLAPRFTDGQVWVDGYAFKPEDMRQEQIAAKLVRALDPQANPRWGGIGYAQWLLRHRKVLVVIDGVEDAGQVFDLIPHRAWPSAMILTSRNRLRLKVVTLALPPLSPEAGSTLLRAVSGNAETLSDPQLLSEFVCMTGGLPLALAALGALATQYAGSGEELLHQLRNEVTRSSFTESEIIPPETHGVLAAAYAQLHPDSAALLRVIGLLPSERFTLAELQQATRADPDALAELLANAFVERDGMTYRTHPIVRRFAREQLGDEEPGSLGSETVSVRPAVPFLSNILLRHREEFADRDREPSDRIEAEEYALRLATERGDQLSQARALANLGALHLSAGHVDDAAAALRVALDTSRRAHDEDTSARTALALAHIEYDCGRLTSAEEHYELSARLFERLKDRGGRARALASLGDVLAERGYRERASDFYGEALAATPPNDSDGQAHVEGRLAYLAQAVGDIDRARILCHSALQHVDDPGKRGELCLQLALLEAQDEHLDTATELLKQALAAQLRADHPDRAVRAILALGALDVEQRKLQGAWEHFERAAELVESGDEQLAALIAYGRGLVAQERGGEDEAIALLELAVSGFRETDHPLGEAQALYALAQSLLRTGQDAAARAAQADAEGLFDRLGVAPENAARSLRTLMLTHRM